MENAPTPCRGCGKPIRFITMVASGKQMPVDAEEIHGNGFDNLITANGRMEVKPNSDITGYRPHWATCTKAKEFKS